MLSIFNCQDFPSTNVNSSQSSVMGFGKELKHEGILQNEMKLEGSNSNL